MKIKMMLGTAIAGAAAALLPTGELHQSFDVDVPLVPSVVVSGGRSVLAFEVHATNFTDESLTIRAIRTIDTTSGRPLASYVDEALATRTRIVGATRATPSTVVPGGGRALVYVELDLAAGAALRALVVEVDYLAPNGRRFTARTGTEEVNQSPVPVLAPPMKNGTWVAVHHPSWDRGHRRVIYTLGGRARIPGRYAVDWVGVDEKGRVSSGDPDRPADAVGYGAAVLAGADAVVTAVRDDMQEAPSISKTPAQPLGSGSGNYVVLRLGPGRYAFYEHLRPGSISVRPGDRVRVGQTIGAVGFTGDTTGPHLHLHVADCASPLECEGVPFTVSGMKELGRYLSLPDLGVRRWREEPAPRRAGPQWPGYNVVVAFQMPE